MSEIRKFAKQFKLSRLSMGLTQTQVGQALNMTDGPTYSQSAICRFEKLDLTAKSAQKIKPVLEQWMVKTQEKLRRGEQITTKVLDENPRKRKRRTSFTPQVLEILNRHFQVVSHPSGIELTRLAYYLGHDREVIRIWFCNKRQSLKNMVCDPTEEELTMNEKV